MRWVARLRRTPAALLALAATGALLAAACGGGGGKTVFLGGIPDQDVTILQARFEKLAEYLTEQTGVPHRYVPSQSYAAVVTAFRNNSLQLAWFGGLTGVQARLAVPGAQAIAQRDIDERFTSVFVARRGSGIRSLDDLRGKSFTFGSESSTSGHLMPRFFLEQAGIDPERDLRSVSFSGSHDRTWKLVEAGAFDAGALNANVWQTRVAQGLVDLDRVYVFFTTPPYVDYHWVVRPGLDEVYGQGYTEKLRRALLHLNAADGGMGREIMEAFQASQFIPTENGNYRAIEDVARQLGIIGEP